MRIVEDDVVQAHVDFVQEPIMNEVTRLRGGVEHSSLRQEGLECGPRKGRIGYRRRVMRVEVGVMNLQSRDRPLISSPEIVL